MVTSVSGKRAMRRGAGQAACTPPAAASKIRYPRAGRGNRGALESPAVPALLDLPKLTVRGTPTEMGRQHGQALAAQIRAFVAMRLEAALLWGNTIGSTAGTGAVTVPDLIAAGRRCMDAYAAWHPDGFAEHCGIAQGAGVDAGELYTAANMTDVRDVLVFGQGLSGRSLRADAEGCSAALLPAQQTRDGMLIAAQTWDLNPQDIDYVVAIRRIPSSGPQTWSVTCSGCLSLVGMNETGLCVGTTNVKTRGSRPGVGYMGILHRMLNCTDFDSAAELCRTAPRAAAHTYWLADAARATEWETTADSAVARELGSQPLVRTNHCLVAAHAAVEGEPPSASSLARLRRMETLAQAQRHDPQTLRDLFADRGDGVDSINRLPEDAQGTTTNSVVVCVPQKREIWACRGPADRGHWQLLPFGGAA